MTDTLQTHAPAPSGTTLPLHPLGRRLMHWINAAAIIVMIGSGWRIYDSYPALPLDFGFPPVVTLGGDISRSEALNNEDGLANALLWHFAAMWVLVLNFAAYLFTGMMSGHFRRDFLPLRLETLRDDFLAALRGRLDHRLGSYNAVQKAFYWGVLLAVLITILSGLSIWKPVQLQELTWLFGGYEFARVVHCLGMVAIVAFLIVHIALTILVPSTLVAMVLGRGPRTSRRPGMDRHE